jgi:hypothetical protein
MGYYDYQNGLIYRRMNQGSEWDRHLENCRNFIIKTIDHFTPSHITVIGSGWLLDLPLAELVERSVKTTLIDIVHPPDVREQTEGIDNIELIETDATGGLISEVWKKAGGFSLLRRKTALSDIVVPEFVAGSDPGLVISLNILTQLEVRIIELIRRRTMATEDELLKFRTEIQEKHINFLKKHNSVLITDYAEIVRGKNGETKTVATLLTSLPDSRLRDEWIWNFDLIGSDYYTNRSVMKIIAITV